MSIDTPSAEIEAPTDSTPRTGSTTFITTSGGLLTEELVRKLRQRQCEESAVRPETFALPQRDPPSEAELEEEIGDVWNTLRERWDELTMNNELFGMDVSDTRNKWILKLFRELDFEPIFQRENLEAGGLEANLSHKGWPDEGISNYGEMEGRTAPILHTVEPGQELDEKPDDAPRGAKSPHDTLQEFLNASDDQDWAVVTNGLTLRVLRDYYHTYTRGYVEFDLENMFTNRNYGDFRALYRLCHASRFIEPVVADEEDDEVETPLEQLYQVALSTGVKVGEDLQENVVSALETLGNGFLNSEIEKALEEGGQDTAEDYYQDLLYVVYRLLFLMFAEQRGMMSQRDSLYTEEYSVTKLRERAEQREQDDRNTDLWEGLKATFELVGEGDERLGVPGYNGGLFDDDNLEYILDAECPNEKLLSAVGDLTHIEQEGYRQRISYADLGVEEIGAVYESLLEFTPQIAETVIELEDRTISTDSFYLDDRGMERKETGSYYTDPGLIDELIQSALKPVVEDRVDDDATVEVKEQQLLDITVCDPACGSGAFLIAANNYLGKRLAQIRADSKYPDERTLRQAKRSVVQHCLYGVDLNPMAVDLAKVSLWINSAVENKPLSFLDHRIKQGNSLIGTTPGLLGQGVPEDAYETSQGRDWHNGNSVRKRVRNENKELKENSNIQAELDWQWESHDEYVDLARRLDEFEEQGIDDIQEKEDLYEELKDSEGYQREKLVFDVWTAAFYWPLDGSADEYPTPKTIEQLRREPPGSTEESLEELTGLNSLRKRATKIAEEESFFHWPLEFPTIFENDGFDCLLGNPPWEALIVRDREFFAVRKPKIAQASTTAKREKLIEQLADKNPELYQEYNKAVERTAQRVKFIHESGRYPLTGRGNLNTYAVFAEVAYSQINPQGYTGIIVPTGIATDSRTQHFFQDVINNQRLRSLFDFENQNIFPDVHREFKFCLLTLSGESKTHSEFSLAFNLHSPSELRQDREFRLSIEDIHLLNPNTNNLPIFNNKKDANLVLQLYREVGPFVDETRPDGNPWDFDNGSVFHISHDSGIFETKSNLENSGWTLNGNYHIKDSESYLPLYEPKMIHQYNHRFATFEDATAEDIDNGNATRLSPDELNDPTKYAIPRYWVPEEEYESKSGVNWHLALRKVTKSTNRRTVISSILPRVAPEDNLNLIRGPDARESLLIQAVLNSYVLDYAARQKVDVALSYYIIKQLPVPSPSHFEEIRFDEIPIKKHIVEKSLKLTYTCEDLRGFAEDAGVEREPFTYTGDGISRESLRYDLEALVAHLYGVDKDDFDRIFDKFEQIKEDDIDEHGYYRTREEIKKRFDQLSSRMSYNTNEKE